MNTKHDSQSIRMGTTCRSVRLMSIVEFEDTRSECRKSWKFCGNCKCEKGGKACFWLRHRNTMCVFDGFAMSFTCLYMLSQ